MDTWCSRQFTWNVIPYLVSIKRQQQTLKVLFVYCGCKKCVILLQAQSFYTDPGENLLDTWYVYMLRNKTVTKLHNAEPDICYLWHAKSVYFRRTDTLRIQWLFPLHKVGVAFLIYESNQDRPRDFVMSCWQSLCSRSWISLSMVVFQRQYFVLHIILWILFIIQYFCQWSLSRIPWNLKFCFSCHFFTLFL